MGVADQPPGDTVESIVHVRSRTPCLSDPLPLHLLISSTSEELPMFQKKVDGMDNAATQN